MKNLKDKIAERKDLKTQKDKTSILNPIQHIKMNQQLTTITEEIEELTSWKEQLISQALYLHVAPLLLLLPNQELPFALKFPSIFFNLAIVYLFTSEAAFHVLRSPAQSQMCLLSY